MKKYTFEDTADYYDIELAEKLFIYLEKVGFSENDLKNFTYNDSTYGSLAREFVSNETYDGLAKIVIRVVHKCRDLNWVDVAVKCFIRRPDHVIPVFDINSIKNISMFKLLFEQSKELAIVRSRNRNLWERIGEYSFYSSSDNLSA